MKALVIYMDKKDEICISYAKEIGEVVYVLKLGRTKPSYGVAFEGKNLMKDIQNFNGRADVIIFRKSTVWGKTLLDSRKKLEGFKFLAID